MLPETLISIAATLVASSLLTGLVRRYALSRGVLDIPNERSSHKLATPRGGGGAIVLAFEAGLFIAWLAGRVDLDVFLALAVGGGLVAAVGYVDDRRGLSPALRLVIHFAAALWALAWLGGLPPIQAGDHIVRFGGTGYALGALGIVWTLNLFNFMDGIDGLAGAEAVFISAGGAMLAIAIGSVAPVFTLCAIFGSACAGFLVWNWPPARIFMGDVGSGFLGFVVAILAIVSARENPVALPAWLILGGVFFTDATVTFLRRLVRREYVHAAHRSHAYQWLARRWGRHLPVTLLAVAVNVLWLLPLAFMAVRYPRAAMWIVGGALLPLAVGTLLAGAGRAEEPLARTRR